MKEQKARRRWKANRPSLGVETSGHIEAQSLCGLGVGKPPFFKSSQAQVKSQSQKFGQVKPQVKSRGQYIFKSSLKSSLKSSRRVKNLVKSSLKSSCRIKNISSQASSQVTGSKIWSSQASSHVAGQNLGQVKSRSSQVDHLFWSSHQVKSSSQAACPPLRGTAQELVEEEVVQY